METRLPTFRGTPLTENPAETLQIGFLEGGFGIAFIEEYNERVKYKYKGNSALNILGYNFDVVKGSNPFAVVLANQILRQEGLRTATQADLEKTLRTNALNLAGTYEDTGLVLRSEDNPNTYLAKDLMNQVKKRNNKQNLPVMIPLTGLELKADSNSSEGLAFNLLENAEVIYAPTLSRDGNFNSEDIDKETGLPTKLGKGNRTLYTRKDGLSRLCFFGGLGVGSGVRGLAVSDDVGRVVVVSAEGTPQNS